MNYQLLILIEKNKLILDLDLHLDLEFNNIHQAFNIKIPRNVKEALLFDKINENMKWTDAIAKEMDALMKLDVFEFLLPNCSFSKENAWQYAPMHMIYTINQEGMAYKVRFVMN